MTLAHSDVINIQYIYVIFFGELIFIHADNDIFTAVDTRLFFSCRLFNSQFWQASFYGLGHAALLLHFFNERPGAIGDILSKRLHHIGAAPGVDNIGNAVPVPRLSG